MLMIGISGEGLAIEIWVYYGNSDVMGYHADIIG